MEKKFTLFSNPSPPFNTNPNVEFKRQSQITQKRTTPFAYFALSLFLLLLLNFQGHAQGSTNEAIWSGEGYSLKKVVSNNSIASGVSFSYTIIFTAPAGVTSVTIEDVVPSSLDIVSVPTPSMVSGVTPNVNISGQTVTYTLSSLPSTVAHSGSFTIVVEFPPGVTCQGESARNRAGILVGDKWEYTPYVSTTATADDPWKVTKSILAGAVVNPSGGGCGYLMNAGETIKYRLVVLKNSPYFGNVVGQQNASGAMVTDVLPTGALMLGNTANVGSASQSGSTITWTIGNLNAANPYAYYYCDIEVYYPAASFPNGSTINNDATLNAVSCNQQITHNSNQTCIEVADIVQNPSGYFKKYLNLTNRVPGCQGYYNIVFCNNGNVPLSAFNINDVIPSGITVNSVTVYGGNLTTTMSLTANSGVNTIASSISSSYFNSGALSFTANDLQLQMTGSLPVGQCINLLIYFTIDNTATGTINNCASFDGLSNSLTLPSTCVPFTVEAGEPDPCLLKTVCSPQNSYEPGDIVRFRLRVQNIGSADLMGGVISDVLHSNFTYVGNETYYVSNTYNPPCSGGTSIPSGTTAWAGVTPSHSSNSLSWNLPDIAADCQLFYVGYCGYYGTYGLPYYYIEFDAMVDSFALPGVTPNDFDISGTNLSGMETSNTVNVLVVASFGQEVEKQVSTDGGGSFASSGSVAPGGTARYRLNYKNTSNVPVSSINLVDLLPRNDGTSDWLILNRSVSRGSQFDVMYPVTPNHSTGLIPSGAPPTPTLSYAAGQNICLPPFGVGTGCTTTSWGGTPDQNIRIDYGSFSLAPGSKLNEDFDVDIPNSVDNQLTACNDFAALVTANFLLNGSPQSVSLTPIAAPKVCLTVDTTLQAGNCCDSVTIRQVSSMGADGQHDCCVELITTCEVKAIDVTVGNGTISSASWNCGNLPSGYSGQNSFTFAPNNCATDMTLCVEAAQTGVVTITVNITFANGETCEKTIKMDCKANPSCCDGIKVEPVQGEGCCTRLTSECKVDSVEIIVDNGTLSSASWNCGTLPTSYAGQSDYMFQANGCGIDMTTCVNATQTGVVTTTYVVYFSNGERCEKSIETDCKEVTSTCCAEVKFKLKPQWPHWNNMVGSFNITNLDPTSPICSVEINASPSATFTPGTLIVDGIPSTQSWNSTIIPTSGNLTPGAVNSIQFNLSASNYNGVIEICVVKCDGTRCCFDFKWNKKPWIDIGISIDHGQVPDKLEAVSISPVVDADYTGKIKYVSFGFSDQTEIDADNPQFFAVSAAEDAGGNTPDGVAQTSTVYMGKHNVFFELARPKTANEPLGNFNLVVPNKIPKLGCVLFDEEGNLIFSGEIDATGTNTAIGTLKSTENMFEFIKLYPNPTSGQFNITYATGSAKDVEIQVINNVGQVILQRKTGNNSPGIHKEAISEQSLANGVYHVVLRSNGKSLSKSFVKK